MPNDESRHDGGNAKYDAAAAAAAAAPLRPPIPKKNRTREENANTIDRKREELAALDYSKTRIQSKMIAATIQRIGLFSTAQ